MIRDFELEQKNAKMLSSVIDYVTSESFDLFYVDYLKAEAGALRDRIVKDISAENNKIQYTEHDIHRKVLLIVEKLIGMPRTFIANNLMNNTEIDDNKRQKLKNLLDTLGTN